MKKIVSLLITLTFLSLYFQTLRGQEEEFNRGRLFLSPEFGLLVGTITRIEISPALGYYITDRLSVAGGFIYEYYKQSDYYNKFETSIYGPKAFARYIIVKNLGEVLPIQSNIEILAHVEYESLSLQKKYFGIGTEENGRFWYNTALIGGGISQGTSGRFKFNMLFLWNTDTSSSSPYPNPIIRIGIQIFLGKIENQ